MGHFVGEDDGDFAEAHDFTVFFPGALVDHLAEALLFDGVDILAAGFEEVADDGL